MASRSGNGNGRKKKTATKPKEDAISLLKADHREVEQLFAEFESADDDAEKRDIAERVCAALTQHAEIEERIFYPAAREALGEEEASLLDEAEVEHASVKQLISEIEGADDDPLFEARVKVLSEYVKHHVKEEEKELMPAAKRSELDLEELGRRIKAEKEGGESDAGGTSSDESDDEAGERDEIDTAR